MVPRKPDLPERRDFDQLLVDLQLRAMFSHLPTEPPPERLVRLARQLDEALARRRHAAGYDGDHG